MKTTLKKESNGLSKFLDMALKNPVRVIGGSNGPIGRDKLKKPTNG